jgi:O-antigen ligase
LLDRATRTPVAALAAVPLLAGPAVLAFFSGAYFPTAQTWAGLIAWGVFAIAALLAPRPLPRSLPGRLSVATLLALAAWTLLSTLWAPSVGPAYHAGQLVALYLGVLLATTVLTQIRPVAKAVEPALLTGIVAVVGYGLSERLLPGVLHFARSVSAQGRLEQPLTYWNAMGELAALGVVLAVRAASDTARPTALRLEGVATAALLGTGLYLSFSRGALFASLAGLLTLAVADPRAAAWRGGAVALAAAVLAAVAVAPFRSVTGLTGGLATREIQGATVLGLLVAITVTALLAYVLLARRARTDTRIGLPRRAPWIAAVVICAGLAIAIIAGAKERSTGTLGTGATRLVTLQSNRYAYWRVALTAFGDEPLRGVGAGGWSVYWLRLRPFGEYATDAHSLELQTLAELGIVGALLLLAWFVATGATALGAYRSDRAAATGPLAVLVTYLAHSPLDWDWQMPALTLVAIVLAGLVLALADRPEAPPRLPIEPPRSVAPPA